MAEKKPEDYLKKLNMPNLCANCGKNSGDSSWPIYSRYKFSFKLTRTTYKKSRFHVPVCNTCKAILEQNKALWLRVSWISGIGIIILLLLAIFLYQYALLFLILSLLGVVGFIFAYIKRSKYWGNSGIASYNGKFFTFTNKHFQKEFKDLNPPLVSEE